ncbi:phage major tail protein, TP901-1 family [Streptococcus sp. ZJ151]|uniref:phage major tail protein, TP901-1 family n=1 Tax=Streptococcus jiangjianxini TaxID=3161189 RepID=UPI0032EF3F99
MAELIQGKDLIAFFRRVKDQKIQDAGKIRFQTEHTINSEKESESTSTKDGQVNTVIDGENSAEFTSLAYREDKDTVNMWKELRKWYNAREKVEFWQVDLGSKREEGGKEVYDVDYFQGYFTNFEISAPSDDKVELSYEYAIDGNGIQATDSLTESQKTAVEAAQYDYHTLAKETEASGEKV